MFSTVFKDIRNATDKIKPHPGDFDDLDNVFYCEELHLLTFDPHQYKTEHYESWNKGLTIEKTSSTSCCKPCLVHILRSYNASGWFGTRGEYIYVYIDGEWMKFVK